MGRARIVKKYRALAKKATLAEKIETGPWAKAIATAVFYHKAKRRQDDVNNLAMLKPAYDGIVEAGLIVDDDSEHLTTYPAKFKVDPKFPRVEITIERG